MTALNKRARQVQRYTNYGVDMMEWDDGTYVKYSDYLALLDELEAAEKRIAEHNFENRLLANADRDIKALRQRIAELEARTVTLPTPYPKGYGLVSDKYNFALEECADAIRAAGIGVKGE